jgi:hypothetical protein
MTHTIHLDDKTYADLIYVIEQTGHLRDTWDNYEDVSDADLLENGSWELEIDAELIITGRRLFNQLKPVFKVFVRVVNGGPLEVAYAVAKNGEAMWTEDKPSEGKIFPNIDLALAKRHPEGMFMTLEEAEVTYKLLQQIDDGNRFAGSNI